MHQVHEYLVNPLAAINDDQLLLFPIIVQQMKNLLEKMLAITLLAAIFPLSLSKKGPFFFSHREP
jgi:hypothetical protein